MDGLELFGADTFSPAVVYIFCGLTFLAARGRKRNGESKYSVLFLYPIIQREGITRIEAFIPKAEAERELPLILIKNMLVKICQR